MCGALAGCPLSRLTAPAPPEGEPSMCAAKSLRKTKSCLPLWGRWTRVSEDGEGEVPASSPSPGEPPSRCATGRERRGKATVSLAFFPALRAIRSRPWDAVPHPASFLSRKLGKELYPPTARTCAGLSMSTSGASCPRRDLPGVQPPRIESGGTPQPPPGCGTPHGPGGGLGW